MCTLIVAWGVFEAAPVVVAANRDEAVDRPSTPPRRREGRDGGPAVVAPRDERAGGTWIGYNEAGVFAGLSNRWSDRDLAGERSRGLLVDDVLARTDVDSAVRKVEAALADAEYAGFNLVVADAETALLLEWDGRLTITEFEPGVHVVMNAGFDDTFRDVPGRSEAAGAQAESSALVREALQPGEGETADDWLERAGAVLGNHDYGVCVHRTVSERRSDGQAGASASRVAFGTRSSSLLSIRYDGTATYRFADGPPCETTFEPVDVTAADPNPPADGNADRTGGGR